MAYGCDLTRVFTYEGSEKDSLINCKYEVGVDSRSASMVAQPAVTVAQCRVVLLSRKLCISTAVKLEAHHNMSAIFFCACFFHVRCLVLMCSVPLQRALANRYHPGDHAGNSRAVHAKSR